MQGGMNGGLGLLLDGLRFHSRLHLGKEMQLLLVIDGFRL
jgi:hypothetical protein